MKMAVIDLSASRIFQFLYCVPLLIVTPLALAVAPGAPTNLTATPGDGQIVLNWTAPPDDGQGAIEAYNVYRCEGTGCVIDADTDWLAWVTEGTTYTDSGTRDKPFVSGTTHRYAVAAYRGEEGNWSNEVEALAQGTPPPIAPAPGTPTNLTATPGDGEIVLNWTAPPDDGQGAIEAYNVYRCEGAGCVIDADMDWLAWVTTGTTYTDRGTTDKPYVSGTTHRYAVAAYRNQEGDWSNEVEAVARGEPVTQPEEPDPSLAAPTGLTVTATSGTSVSLDWTAPADGISGYNIYRYSESLGLFGSGPGPADGILGYNIYRCSLLAGETTCELEWHVWVANEGDAPPAPTSYTDTGGETGGVVAGVTYLYAVAASYPPDYTASELSGAVAVVVRQGEFEASFESGHQWFRRDVIPKLSGTATWQSIAWKGERIQQHILVNNVPSGSRISLASSDLTAGANATISAAAVSFRYPRFVAGHNEVRTCGTADNRAVYLSDALFSEPAQTLPASWPELVWMSVDIPSDTPAGEYTGTVTVSAVSGATTTTTTTLQVSIDVVPWTLPDAADRQFHLDVWQFPVSVLDRYNDANPDDKIEVWSEDHYALLEPTYRYLAGLGQRTVTTYIKEGALYAGDPSMIRWTLKRDGAWEYDYSVFDAYVTRLASWGLDQQISAFSPRGWNKRNIPYWDEATQTKKTFSADVGSSPWNARWRHFLTDFRAHLLEKGWLSKTVLYLDEAQPKEEVQAVIDLVGSIDGNWKIGLAYIGSGQDGPGESILSQLYDRSGSLEWRSAFGTTYVDTGLVTGETYRYAVDAADGPGNASAASPPVTLVAQAPAVPGQPAGLTALSASGGIQLSWTAPAATGSSALTGHNIYRCVNDTASCTPAWLDWVESGATSYTDSGVTVNTSYRYTVEACNENGCGNRSGEITAMSGDMVNPQSPGADEMTEADQAQENQAVPPVPTNLTAFAASATAIQLGWEGSAALGFDVYRCVGSETCTPEVYLGWSYADNHSPDPDRISTFYTSCAQPRPNSFVAADADPADMTALPWHALQRRLDGYLRWAFDNWRSSDPLDLREGAHSAGDFSLVYRSGNNRGMTVVPSVRSELLRDGIEGFEKVQVLRANLSSCDKTGLTGRWLERLERTVDTFSSSPLVAGRAADLISQAHDRLSEISVQLTPDMCQ